MKQRTPLITFALLASLLTACSKHSADTASASGLQRQPVFSIAFTNGSSRDDILHQLVQEHAKVLKDSPEACAGRVSDAKDDDTDGSRTQFQ